VRRKAYLVATVVLLLGVFVLPAQARSDPAYPFRNPHLSLDARIDDLLGRLTLDEKIAWLHQSQAAIPRLGIPYFKAGTEALHGVAWSNDLNNNWSKTDATSTVFPQAVGLASTWDTNLIKQVGSAVGDEARGFNAENPVLWGLNLWAPVVNLLRDPRWGRNEEGYSEDPMLTGAISTAYGSGIEGNDPRYLKAAPTLKHYLAYNNEAGRDVTSSNVPPRVLNEYDRQAFKPAIAANAATGVMASYNLVNGRPDTVSPDLNGIERSWTDQTLFNVSDAFAPYNLTGSEHYFATQPEADAAILKAGLNSFTIDDSNPQPMITAIESALSQGLLTEADIDKAVRPVLSLRFRLGQFDPDGGPYAKITPAVINSPAHQQLARETADEATVLLKNSNAALPLDASTARHIAVVGPLENTLYSDWYGGQLPYRVTPLQGIQQRAGAGATVTGSEGEDRIALKDVATGKYVTATGTTDSDAVNESATTPTASTQFDVVDWGQNVLTLRNVANGKYLGYNFGPFLTRDDQPNNWFVQQQFKLEQQPDGTYVIHYAGYETQESWWGGTNYVTVDSSGNLTLGSKTAAGAAHFSKDVISSGVDNAVAAARGADTAVVVVGSMPFINGREAHDRTTMALSSGKEALIKAVQAVNPHTIVVLETSYPDTITWEQQNVPAILWTHARGRRDRARHRRRAVRRLQPGRSAQPDVVPLRQRPAAGPEQLRRHLLRPDLPVLQGRSALSVRLRAVLHVVPVRQPAHDPGRGRGRHGAGQRRRDQHRGTSGRRGGAALHPPAHVAGQGAAQAATRVPARDARARPDEDGPVHAAGGRPRALGRHPRQVGRRVVGLRRTRRQLVGRHPSAGHAARPRRDDPAAQPGTADPGRELRRVLRGQARRREQGCRNRGGRCDCRRLDQVRRLGARAGDDVHRAGGQGERRQRVDPDPPRLADRAGRRHGDRRQHRGRLHVCDGERCALWCGRHARRLPRVRLGPAVGHVLDQLKPLRNSRARRQIAARSAAVLMRSSVSRIVLALRPARSSTPVKTGEQARSSAPR
jgi:beta-glucosidase-like glycosyl hydrolase